MAIFVYTMYFCLFCAALFLIYVEYKAHKIFKNAKLVQMQLDRRDDEISQYIDMRLAENSRKLDELQLRLRVCVET